MLPIKKIPKGITRGDWQVILAVREYGIKGASYQLKISNNRIYKILQRNDEEVVDKGFKYWDAQEIVRE